MIEVVGPVGVGRADHPAVTPWNQEQHALLGAQDHRRLRTNAVTRHHDVDALGGPHPQRVGDAGGLLDERRPDTGRVDHHIAADGEGCRPGRLSIRHFDTDCRPPLDEHAFHRKAAQAERAFAGRGTGYDDCVAGVVDLRVVVLDAADERVAGERGGDREALLAAEMSVVGDGCVASGQQVVEQDAGADVGALPDVMAKREQEGRGPNKMRRNVLDQHPALAQCLAHEAEVALLEVPQPTVNELARPTRRSRGEVPLLDQTHRQAAARSVESNAGPGDPATDHHHVEALGLSPDKAPLAFYGPEPGVRHAEQSTARASQPDAPSR